MNTMNQNKSSSKLHYFILAGLLLLSFMISANRAWLNPRPGFEIVKIPKTIPFMWQYNSDSSLELKSAAFFPEFYEEVKIRINRPGYPILVKILGSLVGILAYPFIQFSALEQAAIGYILLKFFVYGIATMMLYQMTQRFFGSQTALLASGLMLLHPFSVEFISTFHTTELQFVTPIVIIYLFFNLVDRYSTTKNIIFSLIIGYMMLAKQNYAVYLAVLMFAFFQGYWRAVILSGLVHLIPLLLWLIYLYANGLEYYNHEAHVYNQGTWLYEELIFLPFPQILKQVLESIHRYFVILVQFYSIWLLAAVPFLLHFTKYYSTKKVGLFLSLVFALHWFQTFAAHRFSEYMAADVSFLVFACAAYAVIRLVENLQWRKGYGIGLCLCLWTIYTILTFTHFPWVHPKDQPERPLSTQMSEEYQVDEEALKF